MYKVELSNEYGRVIMGTGESIQLTSILGIGLPPKAVTNIEFVGSAGVYETSRRDKPRTITIKGDLLGGNDDINNMYKVVFQPCDIKFTFGNKRRKIKGKCINPEDFVRQGGGFTSFVIQFECDFPYFEDFALADIAILRRMNHFPNYYDEATHKWYIKLPAVATTRIAEGDVVNLGHVEIYPIIKISSSNSSVLSDSQIDIHNETSDKHIKLDCDISPGEVITINLPEREIISSINGDITHYISDDTVLSDFRLLLGNNHISVTNTKSTLGLTCSVEYSNNYAWAVM